MKRPACCPVCKGADCMAGPYESGKWWCIACTAYTYPPPDLKKILAGMYCAVCGCHYSGPHTACAPPRRTT